jgi:small subunit ribosomal protein S16
MVVRIRLARHGTRNNPFYHLVAIRDKAARNAQPIEKLGEYDPIPRPQQSASQPIQGWTQDHGNSGTDREQFDKPVRSSGIEGAASIRMEKRIEWNVDRIKYWLSVGAQPSKPVAKMLDRVSLLSHLLFVVTY